MKSSKKFDIGNVLVYVAMILLVCVIILPPIFRATLKEDTQGPVIPTKKATALICTKQYPLGNDMYTVRVTTNYIDETFQKVTFFYPNFSTGTQVDAVLSEIQTLRSNPAIQDATSTDGVQLYLTKDTIQNDTTNTLKTTYAQDLEVENAAYVQAGYTCQRLTS